MFLRQGSGFVGYPIYTLDMGGKLRLIRILRFTKLYKIILAKRKLGNIHRRYRLARSYYEPNLKIIREWSLRNTEDSNFYYALTPHNMLYLAHFVSIITGTHPGVAMQYFHELEGDLELKRHIQTEFSESNYQKDLQLNYGRRLGWYAIARINKPKVIVETGVDHGVGACILTAAILRNREEGFCGEYIGTDISRSAGQLLTGKYSEVGKILYGDSIESLTILKQQISLFINDSDHSSEYEYREYDSIKNKLAKQAIILGDNSHGSDSLARFSLENSRKFHFFKELPKDHWYPGAGIGASVE